ncbi:MAG TPA: hypothetical protein VHO90_05025 [Bacteroidales bacterium]|nr:hypothetical protein [Bacteroidales bacterium]
MGSNDEIDKLFSSKFENYRVGSTDDEWMRLNSDLKRVNFWKFQFQSFNIFYLIGIVGIATLIIAFFIMNRGPEQENSPLQDSIPVEQSGYNDAVEYKRDSISKSSNLIPQREAKGKKQPSIDISRLQPDTVSIVPGNTPVQGNAAKDSLKTNSGAEIRAEPQMQPDTTSKQPRIRKVKRKTIVKSEAVVVRDTVDIIKKQK